MQLPLTVEGLAQALQTLAQQNATLQHDLSQLRTQNQHDLSQLRTQSQTAAAHVTHRQALIPKPPAPPKYAGERDEETFNRWSFSVCEYVTKSERRSPVPFTDDVRIQIASDYLTSDAAGWYERQVKEAGSKRPFADLDAFLDGLRTTYVPQISGLLLYDKFFNFSQKELSMSAFVDQYLRYAQRLGTAIDDSVKQYLFVSRLNAKRFPRIVENLRSHYDEFSTLNAMTNRALLLADDPTANSPASSSSNAASKSVNPNAMDITAVAVKKTPKPAAAQLVPGSAEYKEKFKDTVCYECKKKGHLARDCHQRKRRLQEEAAAKKQENA
jgi:hypothetical protein